MLRKMWIALAAALGMSTSPATAHAQGTAITYQGLLEQSGVAVNSATDMQFSLWTLSVGGAQIGSTVTSLGVPVSEGLFSTTVDFGVDPYTSGQSLYLQIDVRNPAGSGLYVPMESRQLLTPAPFSLATRGISVDAANNVGIGTANPPALLSVEDGSLWIAGTHGGNLPAGAGAGIRLWMEGSLDSGIVQVIDYSTLFGRNLLLQPDGGNVGIATLTPGSTLTVGGTIETTSGGVKFPDGSVQTSAYPGSATQVLMIGPGKIIGLDTSIRWVSSWFDGAWSTGGEMIAPLDLPPGAIVDRVVVNVHDTVVADLRIAVARKVNLTFSANGTPIDFVCAGNSGFFSTTFDPAGGVQLNDVQVYFVRILPVNGGWPGNSTLAVQSIRVEYRLP